MFDIYQRVIEEVERNKAATLALLQNWSGKANNYAKEQADWTDRTSHARQSLHAGVDVNGDYYNLYLSHGIRYGTYLETGTGLYGPHRSRYSIVPKNKKALYWHGAKHPVREVNHPGAKPHPIVEPTIDLFAPKINRSVFELWG